MSAIVLDGTRIAAEIRAEVAEEVQELRRAGHVPKLAVILAGNNPASEIYVRNKVKASEELGIASERLLPDASVSTSELLRHVEKLNRRDDVDGILVQLPLPPQVDSKAVLLAVSPEKDVDGFHPLNLGNLVSQHPGPIACTPAGILQILKRSNIPIAGRPAVVVGRSDIVGKPVAFLLLHENATVTICHSRTRDLPAVCREGEILVAAIGKPALITREYIRPGAVIIDVGTNRLTSRAEVERYFGNDAKRLAEFDRRGWTLIGDVDPLAAAELASAVTPVPGGVGPLTIAMLMVNTVKLAKARHAGAVAVG